MQQGSQLLQQISSFAQTFFLFSHIFKPEAQDSVYSFLKEKKTPLFVLNTHFRTKDEEVVVMGRGLYPFVSSS